MSGLGTAEVPASSRQGEGSSPMARAQALLALTATPRSMPCRDNERAAITSFVEESLTAGDLLTHSTFGFPSWQSSVHLY